MTILDLPFRSGVDRRAGPLRPRARDTLSLVLMLAMAYCVAGAIDEVGWAEGTGFLVWEALLAMLLAYALATSPLPGPLAGLVATVLGLELILITVGGLWPPLAYVRADLAGLGSWWDAARWGQWAGLGPAAPETMAYVGRQVGAIVYRVWVWLWRAYLGQPNADRQVWLLLVSIGLYAVTFVAGWQVFRHWRASLAMVALGAALGTNSFLASQRPTWALAFMGLGLVLLARGGARGLEARWRARGTDYSEELLPYATMIGLALAALAMIVSPLVPTLSSRATYEAFWKLFREPWSHVEDTTGRLFGGLDSPPRRNPLLQGDGAPDLSGDHAVGASAPRGTGTVMWVMTSDPAPEPWAGGMAEFDSRVLPQRHWRGATYDTYTGVGWTNRHRETQSLEAGDDLPVAHPEARKEFVQQYRMLGVNSAVYTAGQPVRVDQALDVTARSPDDPIAFTGRSFRYEVVSLVPDVTVFQLEAAGTDYPEAVAERYLALPDVPGRLKRIVQEVVASAETPYGRARAIEEYLRQFEYDLDVPAAPADQDVVDHFIFDLQRGYCDHFSTAMAVMLRLAGVPARVAVGYARGHYDHAEGHWVVTEADSHAWVEVYFPGYGWIEFEPTPSQEVYVYPLGEARERPRLQLPEPPPAATGWRWPLSASQTRLAVLGLAVAAGVGVVLRRYAAWAQSTPEDRIARSYFQVARVAARLGVRPRASETVREFWARLRAAFSEEAIFVSTPWGTEWVWQFDRVAGALRYVLTAYERAQFGPARLGPQVARRAAQEAGRLRREFALLWLARRMGE